MENQNKECRNCHSEVTKGVGRCPYCGILNPTIEIKDIFKSIFWVFFFIANVTYLLPKS